MDFLLISNI